MRYVTTALTLSLAVLLSGCITMPDTGGWLTHHVTVTLDDKSCMAASRWGSIAITGDINPSECRAIVEGRKAREKLRLIESSVKQ
jgi:hypothetical protein